MYLGMFTQWRFPNFKYYKMRGRACEAKLLGIVCCMCGCGITARLLTFPAASDYCFSVLGADVGRCSWSELFAARRLWTMRGHVHAVSDSVLSSVPTLSCVRHGDVQRYPKASLAVAGVLCLPVAACPLHLVLIQRRTEHRSGTNRTWPKQRRERIDLAIGSSSSLRWMSFAVGP